MRDLDRDIENVKDALLTSEGNPPFFEELEAFERIIARLEEQDKAITALNEHIDYLNKEARKSR